MSGGSFNYFFSRAPEEVRSVERTLASMRAECRRDERLVEVAERLEQIEEQARSLAIALEMNQDITHAIEWWASGDSGPDAVLKALEEAKALEASVSDKGKDVVDQMYPRS